MPCPVIWAIRFSTPGFSAGTPSESWRACGDCGTLPYFYPYENTLAYSEHLLGIAIFVAPIHWLTGNPIVAYNVAFLSSYVLAGTGMYLLARTLTGSWMAAMVAGAAFAFGPNRVDQISHLQMLMWGWMPFSVWALHRYFAFGSRRALALFALTFLILGLSNGYFLYYFGLPVGVLIAAEVVHRRRYWKRHALDLGAAAAGMLIVLWPIISAYLDSRLNQGLVRNRDVMRMYSADVTSYLQVPSSIDLWAGILRTGPEGTALFPGLVVIVLAIVGLAARGRYAAWPGRGTDLSTGRQVALYGGIGALMFCLSLGPEPQWGGRTLLASGPYDWLLLVVPGLDGLRVPARMAPVVYLSLAALAAIGVSAICRWLPRRATVAVSLLLVAGICLEGYPGPTRVARFVTQERPNDVAAYEWLASAPLGAMIELPFVGPERLSTTLGYMHATLRHDHPIVNGYSGYRTELSRYLASGGSPFLELPRFGAALRGARALGVRYVTVHGDEYDDRELASATVAAFQRHQEQVRRLIAFGETMVVELEPGPAPQPAGDSAGRLVAPEALWLSERRQVGDEWVRLRLNGPRDIARVRLGMARRSLGDYPRRLLVESSSDGSTYRRLYHDTVVPQLLQGIIRQGAYPPIDIDLPPNRTIELRLRQTGTTRSFYWSIHELQLWERDERAPPSGSGQDR